tara:strand:- start:211 stop:390 length:180 start_codon:yes stop_codon:yes gene_type:complete
MEIQRRGRGRPKGSTQYGEPKEHYTHFMTQTAHDWIKENKDVIEKLARGELQAINSQEI